MAEAFDMMDADFRGAIRAVSALCTDDAPSNQARLRELFRQGARLYIGMTSGRPATACDCAKVFESAWMRLDLPKAESALLLMEAGPEVPPSVLEANAGRVRNVLPSHIPVRVVQRRIDAPGDQLRLTLIAAQGDR